MTWWRDWRVLATVAGILLAALLAAFVIDAAWARNAALDALRSQTSVERTTETRLLTEIHDLQRQADRNASRLAALQRELALLRAQLRAHGLTPVTDAGPSPTASQGGAPSPRPSGSPSPQPSRSGSPSPSPSRSPSRSPSPSPSPTCIVRVAGHCLP